jgi:hypothetical protein
VCYRKPGGSRLGHSNPVPIVRYSARRAAGGISSRHYGDHNARITAAVAFGWTRRCPWIFPLNRRPSVSLTEPRADHRASSGTRLARGQGHARAPPETPGRCTSCLPFRKQRNSGVAGEVSQGYVQQGIEVAFSSEIEPEMLSGRGCWCASRSEGPAGGPGRLSRRGGTWWDSSEADRRSADAAGPHLEASGNRRSPRLAPKEVVRTRTYCVPQETQTC